MDDYQIAIPYFSKLLKILREMREESVLPDIQNIIRAVVKLKLRLLPQPQKNVLNKIRAQNPQRNADLVQKVISCMVSADPSEYLDALFSRAASDFAVYLELACAEQLVEDTLLVIDDDDNK
jgi:hypothetical protein